MKKRLICLGLILCMAFLAAACGAPTGENQGNDPNPPQNGSQTEDPPAYTETVHLQCDLGYAEETYTIDPQTELQESVFSLSELKNSAEYKRNSAPFAGYDEAFFAESCLLVCRHPLSTTGGIVDVVWAYTHDEGKTVTANVQFLYGDTETAGNALVVLEMKKDEVSEAEITVNYKAQKWNFDYDEVLIMLTEEASWENIWHDYTPEDFPEIDAVRVEEIDGRTSISDGITHRIRQCLTEDPTGATIPDHLRNNERGFSVYLTEQTRNNVLRAVELLRQRDDVLYASPSYHVPAY